MHENYVSDLCRTRGCQLHLLASMTEVQNRLAEQLKAQLGKGSMSQALWCDSGGHAFSERDPGRQRVSITVLDEESGEEKMEARDFCGECAEKAGLLKRRTKPTDRRQIEAEARAKHTDDLERELGVGQYADHG